MDLLHPYRGDRPYLTDTGADGSFRPGAELEMSPGEGDMGDKGVPGALGGGHEQRVAHRPALPLL